MYKSIYKLEIKSFQLHFVYVCVFCLYIPVLALNKKT